MIYNIKMSDEIVRGSDLDYIINAINQNEVLTDQITLAVDKTPTGSQLRLIDQGASAVGESTESQESSFSISVSKNESDEYIASVESGIITIENYSGNDFVYAIPSEEINIKLWALCSK